MNKNKDRNWAGNVASKMEKIPSQLKQEYIKDPANTAEGASYVMALGRGGGVGGGGCFKLGA